jgi:hypothetical protein
MKKNMGNIKKLAIVEKKLRITNIPDVYTSESPVKNIDTKTIDISSQK